MRDIDSLLRLADPSPEPRPYTTTQRATLLRDATRRVVPRRAVAQRVVAIAVAAGVLAVALGVWNPQAAVISARADEVLTQAAINAVDPPASSDQWWQISSDWTGLISTDSGECWIRARHVTWVAVDGTRPTVIQEKPVEVVRHKDPEHPCDVDEKSGVAASRSTNLAPGQMPPSWQSPSPQFLDSLPRDAVSLRRRLYADTVGVGRGADAAVFTYVSDVLRSGLVPSDLRSALFEVIKTLPGIDIASEEKVGGRTVVGFAIVDREESTGELLIDPNGGTVVGERSTAADGELFSASSVKREVVEEVPRDVMRNIVVSECEVLDDGNVECQS